MTPVVLYTSSPGKQPERKKIWGDSSAGRALEWHSRGQRFDPAYLHQRKGHPKRMSFFRCHFKKKQEHTLQYQRFSELFDQAGQIFSIVIAHDGTLMI